MESDEHKRTDDIASIPEASDDLVAGSADGDEKELPPEVLALASGKALRRYQIPTAAGGSGIEGKIAHDGAKSEHDAAPDEEELPYIGPPIGSVAKTAWPELLGTDVDEAVTVIETERTDMLLVQPTRMGAIVSSDMAARRVRLWFDPATRKVVEIPRIG